MRSPDAQRQSDVGDAARMAAKAEDDKAAGDRGHAWTGSHLRPC